MSIFNDKALKNVADIAAKIMQQEATHPKTEKEKDLAAMGHPKDKITHKDVLIGRGVLKKEEASCEDEVKKHEKKMHGKEGEVAKHVEKLHKEDTEQLQEYQSKDGVYKHKGTYGTEKGADYGETDWDKENKDAKKLTKPKASRKLGPRQNYVRSPRVNESFTDMIAAYQEKGLKALVEMSPVEEEVDNETFTKEFEDQKASMEGKKKQPSVAAPATQGVKQMPEEIEIIDANEINGVTIDTIEEKALTEPEMKKKEEVVKSMKKGLSGFKQRYGDRAKNVLYATATRIAKEKA